VRQPFRFLLERKPATSILRQFSLSDISRYFPEYPSEFERRLALTFQGGSASAEDSAERRLIIPAAAFATTPRAGGCFRDD
jgi:hypothetical protein